jgi:alkyl sulfatase BDS1-like metallo-beta-lactamase superfamily hydrolase
MRLLRYKEASVALAFLLMLIAICGTAAAQEFAGREKLRAHSAEFRRKVIKITNGVWVAVGFSDANSALIEGEDGSIVVDTTSNVEDATAVKAEFAKLSTAPVRAIIYTHSHPDHIGGAGVFAGNDHPEILAHQLFVDRVPDVGRNGRDGGDQFGSTLPDALFINAGTGLEFGRHPAPTAYVAPTRTFSGDRLELSIGGVPVQLLHTPGETRENVAVWLPDRRVLLPGDDFYKSFPALYAIRGARLRPIDQWIASLGVMVDLGADYLVPGHTRPVPGSANVRAALTTYRDGIKSILDQTLEGMKKGAATGRTGTITLHFRPRWPTVPTCRNSTEPSPGRCVPSTLTTQGGSMAIRRSCSRCPKRIGRPESLSWVAVANWCYRGHVAPSPTRTSSGPPS